MNKRKQYMKDVYPKYWARARDTVYGSMHYDEVLIDTVEDLCVQNEYNNLLEVAIGTGVPIAKALSMADFNISGLDISQDLLDVCRERVPRANCTLGDAENMPFDSEIYDLSYCFHSSFFFPDFDSALSEMLRVTRPGGAVVFDVQNSHNPAINKIWRQHYFENRHPIGRVYKVLKNSIKYLTGKGTQDWPFLVTQTPGDPMHILEALATACVEEVRMVACVEGKMVAVDQSLSGIIPYDRLVFVVKLS